MRRVVFLAICVAALAMLALPAAASAAGFVHLQTWGGVGSSDGRANWPDYLWADSKGSVWVADWNNDRVQRFTADGGFMESFGSVGSGAGQLLHPTGVCFDEADQVIYVADAGNNRIEKFTRTGVYLTQWGSLGAGNGQFSNPHGIGVDGAGNVYVVDMGNNRVQVFDSSGTWLRQIGSAGSGDGQFAQPSGVVVLKDGTTFVSEFNNSRIQRFDPTGAWVQTFGSPGSGNGQMNGPMQLSQDKYGNLLVCDWGNNRIARFTQAGGWLGSFGSTGSAVDGTLQSPEGVSGDAKGFIYVTDLGTSRIQKFVYDDTPPTVVIDNDHEWHSADYVVWLTASDDFAGFDHWLFFSSTFDFNPIGVQVSAFADHSHDGLNAVTLTAFDRVDNAVSNTTHIKIDTRPPVTTVSGDIYGDWSQTDVTLDFAATDRGAGVAHTYFTIDGGPATEPNDNGNLTLSSEGSFAVGYWSVDAAVPAGNIEATRSLTVNIDKTPPVPLATANVAVKRGRTATFKYSVTDNLSPTVMARILIFKKTKLAKVIYVPDFVPSATVLSKKARITLPIGKYTWMVEAMDLAYNDALSAPKVLTVK